jgi:hypothetical protein
VREKELHILQLLKERDLERAEVTRAASQADDAEQTLAAYKQEFEQVYRDYPHVHLTAGDIPESHFGCRRFTEISFKCFCFVFVFLVFPGTC